MKWPAENTERGERSPSSELQSAGKRPWRDAIQSTGFTPNFHWSLNTNRVFHRRCCRFKRGLIARNNERAQTGLMTSLSSVFTRVRRRRRLAKHPVRGSQTFLPSMDRGLCAAGRPAARALGVDDSRHVNKTQSKAPRLIPISLWFSRRRLPCFPWTGGSCCSRKR